MTNQQKIEDNFSWEKDRHYKFFLPYYNERNWIVVEDHIESNQKNEWDVRLNTFVSEYKKVDEKAFREEHNICFVEIIQDLASRNWGWLLEDADWILYGSWNNNQISSLYKIELGELKNYVLNLVESQKMWIPKEKGWGQTWNLLIEWPDLINKNIAEKLFV